MPQDSLLQLRGITRRFGEQTAVNQLDLSVREGEVVALIGPSGSGKSTIMNLITRTLTPDAGQILLDQKDIARMNDRKRFAKQVGMLRQQFDLVDNLSVIHNVLAGRLNEWGLGRSLLSIIKPQDKHLAIKALQSVGMEHKMDETTINLSGGEQQRIAIARLLVQDPRLFLADEPISSLDPANAKNVLSLLTSLVRQEKKTLIASMHSVDFALEFFDRLIGLREGQLVFDTPVTVLDQSMLDDLYGLNHE